MRYHPKVFNFCIAVGWIAIVFAFCWLAILFWHLLLFWFVNWPGDLATQKEKAMVALGGPALYAGVHFWAYAYIKLWFQSDVERWRMHRLKLVQTGISLYLTTHIIIVIAIALDPGGFYRAFLEHFHGGPRPGQDIVILVWLCCFVLGTLALFMDQWAKEFPTPKASQEQKHLQYEARRPHGGPDQR